jgi:hypothetical protein
VNYYAGEIYTLKTVNKIMSTGAYPDLNHAFYAPTNHKYIAPYDEVPPSPSCAIDTLPILEEAELFEGLGSLLDDEPSGKLKNRPVSSTAGTDEKIFSFFLRCYIYLMKKIKRTASDARHVKVSKDYNFYRHFIVVKY